VHKSDVRARQQHQEDTGRTCPSVHDYRQSAAELGTGNAVPLADSEAHSSCGSERENGVYLGYGDRLRILTGSFQGRRLSRIASCDDKLLSFAMVFRTDHRGSHVAGWTPAGALVQ
jgi:hypothetical protein